MQTLGPVLFFRGIGEAVWNLSALVGIRSDAEPAALTTDNDTIRPQRLAGRNGCTLWRYDFNLPRGQDSTSQSYAIGARNWPVCVPGTETGLRVAFTACNGSEQDGVWQDTAQRNERWRDLAESHEAAPFHLLLQGGDQLYADAVWRDVPTLKAWQALSWRRRRNLPLDERAEAEVGDHYFNAYCWLWSQPELAPLIARIPSLMMWDDHDIFDGWGSYASDWQDCPVFKGVYRQAREAFSLFQLGARPDDLPAGFSDRRGGHFGWAYRIGEVGIVAPDLRSHRRRTQVMGPEEHADLDAALETMADCRRILLIVTVPLANARLGAMEWLFNRIPGHQSWQDDMVDQWPSLAHGKEWADLLERLTAFSARTGARLTSLSGEIHLGAHGLISGRGTEIHQLTASGIVHPPPGATAVRGIELASLSTMAAGPDVTVRLLPMPDSNSRYLRARNWLELDVAKGGGLAATWHSVDEEGGKRLQKIDI